MGGRQNLPLAVVDGTPAEKFVTPNGNCTTLLFLAIANFASNDTNAANFFFEKFVKIRCKRELSHIADKAY
ncbi:MAG: hypothetical protein Kow0070_14340 [Anaerolineales bacterium]